MQAKVTAIQMTCNGIIGNLPAAGPCSPDSAEHRAIQ